MALQMRTLSRLQALQRKVAPAARPRTTEPASALADFIAQSPDRTAPTHLQPVLDVFERIAAGEQVRALISTPPQHGKSETVLHGLVWLLLRDPKKRHAYATYAQSFTRDQVQIAERIAQTHSLQLDRSTLDRWATPEGGGVTWTSRGGPLTGRPVDGLLLHEDPLKDRLEANRSLIRRPAMDRLKSTAFKRPHPSASTLVIATRWHLDDPTGQLIKKGGWEVISLPAITPAGEALWPEARPLEWLEEQRNALLPADWHALYMADPRPTGASVFQPPTWYETLPAGPYREAHGFDAAYTAKTTSDHTVTVTGRLIDGVIYVTGLIREQLEPGQYIPLMKTRGVNHVTWFRSGTERGLEELLKREGIRVNGINATTDKLSRAIPAATSWNRGEIRLPAKSEWAGLIESETATFTGQGDESDDIIDALAGLHHALFNRGEVTDA